MIAEAPFCSKLDDGGFPAKKQAIVTEFDIVLYRMEMSITSLVEFTSVYFRNSIAASLSPFMAASKRSRLDNIVKKAHCRTKLKHFANGN